MNVSTTERRTALRSTCAATSRSSRASSTGAGSLPRFGRHLAEAGGGDRRDEPTTWRAQRECAPRRVRLAQEADAAYDGARTKVARFVGGEPRTTIFTKNVTEAINLVAYAWGRANVGPATRC